MSSSIILPEFWDFALYSHKVISLLQSEVVPCEEVPSQAKIFLQENSYKGVDMVVTPPVSIQQ